MTTPFLACPRDAEIEEAAVRGREPGGTPWVRRRVRSRWGLAAPLAAALAVFAAPGAGAQGWEKQAPLPTDKNLLSIAAVSATEYWATAGALFGQTGDLVHSTDGGQTWEVTAINASTLNAVFFVDAQHGWAAGNGFFHTTDGGQTWVQDNNWGSIYDLFFLDTQRGWASGNGGVAYRTTDGGLTWTGSSTPSGTTLSSIWFVDPQVGYATGIGGRIVKSTDGGQTWSANHDTGVPNTNLQMVQFLSPLEGWAIGGSTFLHTTDGAQTWTQVPVPADTWSYAACFADPLHGISVGEFGNIVITGDGGQTWNTIQATGTGPRYWDVEFGSANVAVLCGENGGIERTDDAGATWTQVSSGAAHIVRGMDATSDQVAWAAAENGEIARTTNGGAHWERVSVTGFDVYGDLHDIDFVDAQRGWVVGQNQVFGFTYPDGRISRSDDGGKTWSLQFSQNAVEFYGITAIDAQRAIAYGIGALSQGAYLKTTDGGQTWTGGGPAGVGGFRDGVFLPDGQTGWLVGGGIHKTTDGGGSWTQQYPSGGASLSSVSFFDAQNGWAVGFQKKLLRTTDGGQTWVPQTAGGAAGTAYTGVRATGPNSAWIAGWYGYVAHTTDGGQNWTQVSLPGQDAPSAYHECVEFVDDANGWVAGNQGIWRRSGPLACPSAVTYGQGCPGTGGFVPALDMIGCTVAGQPITLTLDQGMPGSSALLLFGLAAGQAPLGFGCSLLVTPVLPLVLTVPLSGGGPGTGAFSVFSTLPPGAAGATLTIQAFSIDVGAPLGAAASNGLRIDVQ